MKSLKLLNPPTPSYEMINFVNFMKAHSRNIRLSWNDENHEIKDPSNHLTCNDKNYDIDELAEHSPSISIPQEMMKFMRIQIPLVKLCNLQCSQG